MKPYYEHAGIRIFHGDAREILPSLARADSAIITDPPYGFGAYETDRNGFTDVLTDSVKASGSAAVFGYPELLVEWCVEHGLVPTEWVTWYPSNKPAARALLLPRNHECIALFGAVCGAERLFKRREDGNPSRALSRGLDPLLCRLGDVWQDSSPNMGWGSTQRLHPNEKPVSVMRNLLTLCGERHTIDPYCGSGATTRAAFELGRSADGIEIEERYCEIAAKRLSQEVFEFPSEQSTDTAASGVNESASETETV